MDLIQKISEIITPEVINKISSVTGENNSSIEKGLKGIIPTILIALHNKDNNDLSNIVNEAKNSLASENSNQNHSNILKSIFGDRLENILFSISDFAGIKQSSMHLLANTSVVSVFEAIKKFIPSLDLQGIKNLLNENESSILGLIPSQLNTDSIQDITTFEQIKPQQTIQTSPAYEEKIVETKTTQHYQTESRPGVAEHKKSNPLKWLIPLLLLLAIGYFVWKSCDKKVVDTTVTPIDTTTVLVEEEVVEITNLEKETLFVVLPNNDTLNAYKGGIEEKLVNFLKTDYRSLGEAKLKETWFDFDNLNFETGSANVTQESKLQLDNIVAILKAFPNAKIKIGGYTDKTGNEAVNKQVSKERANAVKAHLEAAGLAKQIDGAEGYGSEFAKFAADAPEFDRALDRRVSISVR